MNDKKLTAIKHDENKTPLDLLPPDVLKEIADVFGHGAKKYDKWNYLNGFTYSRVYASLRRHLNSWYNGEDIDKEFDKSHLAHAGCALMMLFALVLNDLGEDDRYRTVINKIKKEK